MSWSTHRDLRAGGWTPESPGSAPVRLPEKGPTADDWFRFVLNDGDAGAPGALPSERRDCTMGALTLGRKYNLRGFIRFPEGIPTIGYDRWTLAGWEVHGPNRAELRQALIMTEIDVQRRYRLNANAGRDAARYDSITQDEDGVAEPIEAGRVYAIEMEFILTADDEVGYVRVWLDGVQVAELLGRTILGAWTGAYFKEALYRYALNNGRLTKDWSGVVIRVADPAEPGSDRSDLPAFPGDAPAPPPSPADTTPPRVTLSISNEALARLDLPDGDTARVLLGVAGDPFDPIELTGDEIGPVTLVPLPREALMPGVLRWGWVYAWDAAGNRSPDQPGVPFTPVAVTPPPDPDQEDCADVRAQLLATAAERDVAIATLATVRAGVAAETQRHGEAIATALET